MNFIQTLKAEHKEAKSLFKDLLKGDSIDQDTCELLCQKLLLHMEKEEKYFYPIMKKKTEADDEVLEAKLEHEEAKKQIKALMSSALGDVETKVKLEILQLEIEHHVQEEEDELFPLAEKELSKDEIQSITEKMEALQEKETSKAK